MDYLSLSGQSSRPHLGRQHTTRASIVRLIVAVGKMIHANTFVRVGGMDKFAAADIDADMGNAALVGVLEKDKIAGLELPACDFIAMIVLLSRGSRQRDAARCAEDVADKAGAVEARSGGPAHHIAGSAKGAGCLNDIATVQRFVLRGDIGKVGKMLRRGVSCTGKPGSRIQ